MANIPKYTKYQEMARGVRVQKVALYDYYLCSHCKKEIPIIKDRQKATGGIAVIPWTITGDKELQVPLHDSCLNDYLKKYN